MASVAKRKGKRGWLREIQFTFRGRQAIRLGKATKKQADTVRLHVEALLAQASIQDEAETLMEEIRDEVKN